MPSRTTLERLKANYGDTPQRIHMGDKGTKACTVCGKDIKVNARKCIKCGCWLTTRRFLDFSSTFLAFTLISSPHTVHAFVPLLPYVFSGGYCHSSLFSRSSVVLDGILGT